MLILLNETLLHEENVQIIMVFNAKYVVSNLKKNTVKGGKSISMYIILFPYQK